MGSHAPSQLDDIGPFSTGELAAAGLNARPEAEFDELARLAAELCETPIALITLLDQALQHNKAHFGTDVATVPIEWSFCRYAVESCQTLVVHNALEDDRFRENPLVSGEAQLRSYAGEPLLLNGRWVGALAVLDRIPRTLTPVQLNALRILARQVSAQLELRCSRLHAQQLAMKLDVGQNTFRAVLDNAPMLAYLKDRQGRYLFYNRAFAERYHVTDTELLGKRVWDVLPNEAAATVANAEESVWRSGQPFYEYVSLPDSKELTITWKVHMAPCTYSDGQPVLACCATNVTEERERADSMARLQDELRTANHRLASLSLTDALTGLWNRRAFDERLQTEVQASQRSRTPLSLLMIDVDDFKMANDRFGHPVGDVVLRELAGLMQTTKRAEDLAVRYGGEEFALLLPHTDQESAMVLARRLLSQVRSHLWPEALAITISIGVSSCDNTTTAEALTLQADAALYQAKRRGKDQVIITDPVETVPSPNSASKSLSGEHRALSRTYAGTA